VGKAPVAQDEFVAFLKANYEAGGAPVFFDLDNEPNYWVGTHPELYPSKCSAGSVPWDDVAARNIAAAKAVKGAWPATKVFGPVVSGDGMAYGGDYQSPHFVAGTTEFSDWYLQQVAAASAGAGAALLDVFDVHYYTVGGADAECLESPRLFWDPAATDISAAATNSLDFNFGDHSYWDQYWYPRQVIPRLFKKIAGAYAGKTAPLPGLSFSEYNPGCETAISGGVAEADLLGIFGREGVFAAMAWPLKGAAGNYLMAAYDLYRNYDGKGSVVGDTAVRATTSDARNTSVYAFVHGDDAMSVEVVAINKLAMAEMVTVEITSAPAFQTATPYHLVAGSPAVSAATGAAPVVMCASGACTLTLSLPATSATTVILR
jgi:mannan endo-1,4-beta-mannosidase